MKAMKTYKEQELIKKLREENERLKENLQASSINDHNVVR